MASSRRGALQILSKKSLSLYTVAFAVIPQAMSAPAAMPSSQNFTLQVPDGTTNHGDPRLLCTRSKWSDVATFFLANFVAHAATVKSDPGQPMLGWILSMLLALIFPTAGVFRGLDAIRRSAIIGGSPLQKARKAGALCEVVRVQGWEPRSGPGDVVQRVQFKRTRDARNLATLKNLLEARKRWVATKLPWLKSIDIRLDGDEHIFQNIKNRREAGKRWVASRLLWLERINIQKVETLVEARKLSVAVNPAFPKWVGLIDRLDRDAPGVKKMLHNEGILVRLCFYAGIGPNIWRSRKPDSLELSDLPQGMQSLDASENQTTQPRVTFYPKICIEGLGECEVFKPSHQILHLDGRKIHGIRCLPPGYELSTVHSQSAVLELNGEVSGQHTTPSDTSTPNESSSPVETDISWSYNLSKGPIALFQALYASATLYETRGDQIERYGYTAFGLTVAPYLVMSIINLIGTVLTPDYSTIFMVESEIMEEARQRHGASFRGAVGKSKFQRPITQSFNALFKIDDQDRIVMQVRDGSENSEESPQMSMHQGDSRDEFCTVILPACHDASRVRDLFYSPYGKDAVTKETLAFLSMAVGLVSVAINGVLSHFKPGESTHNQRVWIMTWLAFGILIGSVEPSYKVRLRGRDLRPSYVRALLLCCYCAPAIGGFVVVGQMLMSYGRWVRIGDEPFQICYLSSFREHIRMSRFAQVQFNRLQSLVRTRRMVGNPDIIMIYILGGG